MPKHRTIEWDAGFEASLMLLVTSIEEADELLDGVTWVLSRNPGRGLRFEATSVFYIDVQHLDGRRLELFYTFDTEKVYFLHIAKKELDDEYLS